MQSCAKIRIYSLILIGLLSLTEAAVPILPAEGREALSPEPEFSGTLIKRVNGKTSYVHVFVKGQRRRLEYRYAIRTALGFAAIEIVRPDLSETWYVLPQQKELLVLPTIDHALPIGSKLIGELSRTVLGEAVVAGRAAQWCDVRIEGHDHSERFYQWVDAETGIVLKQISQDRDWSFEYERIRMAPQSSAYFDEPPGYRRRLSESSLRREEQRQ